MPLEKHTTAGHHARTTDSQLPNNAVETQLNKPTRHTGANEFAEAGNPLAGAMQEFRHDRMQRWSLLREHPQVYEACKKQDQQEIDKKYGWGKFVRDLDGDLIKDTPANRTSIIKQEKICRDVVPPDVI